MKNSNKEDYIGKPLMKVFDAIRSGVFGCREELIGMVDSLSNKNDHYLVCADFASYMECQDRVICLFFFIK